MVVKKVLITLSADLYRELLLSSEESLRPIATECVYHIKRSLGGSFLPRLEKVSSDKQPNSVLNLTRNEEEIIGLLEKVHGEGYQMDGEELMDLNKRLREAELSYWEEKKILFKTIDGEKRVFYRF